MNQSIILSKKYFLKMPDGSIKESFLEITAPKIFTGFPGGKWTKDDRLSDQYILTAFFPGVLKDEGFSRVAHSTLDALLWLLESIKAHSEVFSESGGVIYKAQVDAEQTINLDEFIKPKNMFKR